MRQVHQATELVVEQAVRHLQKKLFGVLHAPSGARRAREMRDVYHGMVIALDAYIRDEERRAMTGLPAHAIEQARRILDAEARRLLADQLDRDASPRPCPGTPSPTRPWCEPGHDGP